MLKIGTRTFQKVLLQMASKSHVPMSNRGVWFTSRKKLPKLGIHAFQKVLYRLLQ